MADSDHNTSPRGVTRRAVLGSSAALPLANMSRRRKALDPAVDLWERWRRVHAEVVKLTRKWQRLETRLAREIGFPAVELLLPGEPLPLRVTQADEISRWLGETEKAKALLDQLAEHRERWDAAQAALGMDKLAEDLDEAQEAEQALMEALAATPAASLSGVAAKLAMIVRMGEPSPDDEEFPWPELRSVVIDLANLGGTLRGSLGFRVGREGL